MYGKHFASMYEGSMMGAGPVVFAVWGYVIAKAVDSQVELNPKLLAVLIGTDEQSVRDAIDYLCREDPDSRSKENDGRRLVRLGQFSYSVTTHAAYRAIRHEDDRREYNRKKQAEYRQKKKDVPPCTAVYHGVPQSAHTEADTEAEAETKAKNKNPLFEQFWESYPKRRRSGKAAAEKSWKIAIKSCDATTILEAVNRYAESPVGKGEFVKGPAAWLNGGHWADDPEAWGIAPKPASRVFRPGPDWDGGDIYAYARSKGYDVP
jgi:hypothetical protein